MPMSQGSCHFILVDTWLTGPLELAGTICFLLPSLQVPHCPGMLDSGRADHVQGVRDCFGRLAAVTGETVPSLPPPWCGSGVVASGWTFTVERKEAALGHNWFWLPGQVQSREKAMLGSVGPVCHGHRWKGMAFVILDYRQGDTNKVKAKTKAH